MADSLEIEVGANYDKARRATDQFAREVQGKLANVSVGGGSRTGRGGIASDAPTSASVLGPSNTAIAAASDFGHWAGIRSGGRINADWLTGGGGTMPPGSRPSVDALRTFAGTGMSAVGGSGGGAGGGIDRGMRNGPWNFFPTFGGGGGAPGAFSNSIIGRGWGVTIGAGYLAHSIFSAAQASRQYNIDSVLAGNDQRAQAEASLSYRKSFTGSFGWVGSAVGFASDPTGMDEAGIRATLATSSTMDARVKNLRRATDHLGEVKDQVRVESVGGVTRLLRQAEQAQNDEKRLIRDMRLERSQLDDDYVSGKKEEWESTRKDRAKAIAYAKVSNPNSQAWYDTRDAAISALETSDQVAATNLKAQLAKERGKVYGSTIDNTYGSMGDAANALYETRRKNILRDEGLRRDASMGQYGLDVGQAGANILGQFAARDAAQASGNFAQWTALNAHRIQNPLSQNASLGEQWNSASEFFAGYGALAANVMSQWAVGGRERGDFNREIERQRQYNVEDSNSRAWSGMLMLFRRPLDAQLESLKDEESRAKRDKSEAEQRAIAGDYSIRRQVLVQQDTDQRALVMQALKNQGGQLDIALDGGIYGGVRANALAARDAAMLNVQRLEQENGGGQNDAMILQTLTNADKELSLAKRNFFNQFRPSEIDINRTDLSGEGVDDVVKAIADMKKAIVDAIMAVVLTAQ